MTTRTTGCGRSAAAKLLGAAALAAALATGLSGCASDTEVVMTATAVPAHVASGATRDVEIEVRKYVKRQRATVINRNVDVTADIGTIASSPVRLSPYPMERATAVYTAPSVDENTPARVTASTSAASATADMVIHPATATGSWSATAGDAVSVEVSVTTLADGTKRYVWTVTPGAAAGGLHLVNLTLAVPMTLTAGGGATVQAAPTGRAFLVTGIAAGPLTLTASGDVEVGGTAVFDIRKNASTPGVTLNSAGPK